VAPIPGCRHTALKRIAANTVEKRLRTENGQPNFDLNFYILHRKGEYAGVSMYPATTRLQRERPQTLTDRAVVHRNPCVLALAVQDVEIEIEIRLTVLGAQAAFSTVFAAMRFRAVMPASLGWAPRRISST